MWLHQLAWPLYYYNESLADLKDITLSTIQFTLAGEDKEKSWIGKLNTHTGKEKKIYITIKKKHVGGHHLRGDTESGKRSAVCDDVV
ncbi:hypothetical protein AAHA92_11273 [Salvia divinorum]|uniref:Uncharacterized protein n=1 Tax=Salvia divinorum TaxID=28513 RepID=A0ABD1HGH8_SALDI